MVTRIVSSLLIIAGMLLGVVGAVQFSTGPLLALGLFAVLVGLGVWGCARNAPALRQCLGSPLSDVQLGAMTAAATAAVCFIIVGMTSFFDSATTASVLVAILAMAGWRIWRGRPVESRSGHDAAGAVPASSAKPVQVPVIATVDLPTEELCLAWRRSYLALQHASDESTRQQVVRQRQDYLDELERRDPGGFARWLGSGPRAAGDPRRFIGADE
jgi:hypothetical protein